MNERKKQIQLAVEKFTSLVGDVDGVIEVALFVPQLPWSAISKIVEISNT